ncbi:MAG: PIN domain-containing protein [Fibrobacter sp.]|nr:PIN domain-containing protein [Fibrobacter sp.]
MKFLLDSNIVSEGSKPFPDSHVVEMLDAHCSDSALSAITSFELQYGIKLLPEGNRKKRLVAYLDEMVFPFYEVLPYDFECSKVHAEIMAKLKSVGQVIPYQDSQIAATALAKNLVLVTRNVRDFKSISEYFPLKIENWFDV